MSKYYTPKIEEFHVGFECEYQNIDNGLWGTFKHPDLNSLPLEHEIEFIRVKYLDREDIESLGFTVSNNDPYWYDCKNERFWMYKESPKDRYWNISDEQSDISFRGLIKNKSELKKLLIQLSILEDGE